MGLWNPPLGGCKSRFKDCLQQSTNYFAFNVSNANVYNPFWKLAHLVDLEANKYNLLTCSSFVCNMGLKKMHTQKSKKYDKTLFLIGLEVIFLFKTFSIDSKQISFRFDWFVVWSKMPQVQHFKIRNSKVLNRTVITR